MLLIAYNSMSSNIYDYFVVVNAENMTLVVMSNFKKKFM